MKPVNDDLDNNEENLVENHSFQIIIHYCQIVRILQMTIHVFVLVVKERLNQYKVTKVKTYKLLSKNLRKSQSQNKSLHSERDLNLKKCPHCPSNSKKLYEGNRGLKIHHGLKHKDKVFSEDNSVSNEEVSVEYVESVLAHLNKNTKVIKRIPKSARNAAVSELGKLIDICVSNNSIASWCNLLCFAYQAFQLPIRKSKSE